MLRGKPFKCGVQETVDKDKTFGNFLKASEDFINQIKYILRKVGFALVTPSKFHDYTEYRIDRYERERTYFKFKIRRYRSWDELH